jgi:hypothetical protein
VDSRFHCVRQQADRHDQLNLTGTTVLVVPEWLKRFLRQRDGLPRA